MALSKNIIVQGKEIFKSDFSTCYGEVVSKTFSEMYIRVEKIDANKSSGTALVSFENNDHRWTKKYEVPLSSSNGSENFIKQAYEHLKTLPEFAGAADV